MTYLSPNELLLILGRAPNFKQQKQNFISDKKKLAINYSKNFCV